MKKILMLSLLFITGSVASGMEQTGQQDMAEGYKLTKTFDKNNKNEASEYMKAHNSITGVDSGFPAKASYSDGIFTILLGPKHNPNGFKVSDPREEYNLLPFITKLDDKSLEGQVQFIYPDGQAFAVDLKDTSKVKPFTVSLEDEEIFYGVN